VEPSDQLEIFAVVDDATMRLTSQGTTNDSIIKLRQSNDTGMDLIYDGSVDKFFIKDNDDNDRITISNTSTGNNAVGNVGINQLTPTEILDIVGNFKANGNGLFSGTSNPTLTIDHTDSGKLIFNILDGTATATFTSETNDTADDADFAFLTNDGTTTNEIVRFKEDGKVGIGTDNPSQKLDIDAGHIQLSTGYGIGAAIGSSTDEYIIYPYKTGMPTSFTNITAHGTINSVGMSLQSDNTINFIETDNNTLVGHMALNSKIFDWDGVINAKEFKGDGSNLTGITGGQITGFVSTPGDNFLVTSNAAGDGVFGEANLTFDGSTLEFTSTTAPTNGYISFPLLDDTQGEIFRTALRFPSTDDRALLQYGTVGDDDFELRLRLQDGNADKFVIISDPSGTSSDFRALDINGSRALFFSDNSAGKVGIGVTPTATLHAKSTAAASVAGLFEGAEDGILHVNAGSTGTVGENDAVIRLQRQGTNKWGILTTADTGLRIYDYDSNATHTFFETGGNVGVGTDNPGAKLDVRGDVVISDGTDPAITLFNNDSVASGPDILFHEAGLIAAEGRIHLNINSDGGSDDLFIRTGGDTDSATEIARFTNTGRFGLGGIDPGHQFHIKSAAANTDVIVIQSAGTVATKIIQLTDSSNGHGLIDILNNDGTHSARIYGAGSSWFDNKLGIGIHSPDTELHIKSTNNEQIRLEDEDADGDPYISFYNANTHRARRAYIQSYNTSGTSTGNNLRLVSDVGSIQFFTSPVDGTFSAPVENFRVSAGGEVKMRHDKKLTLGGTLGGANDHGFIRFNYPSDSDSSFEIGTRDNSNEPIIFTQTDNERMGIYANGYVGIGINDPETFLSVKTNFSIVNSDFDTSPAAGSRLIMGLGATSGDTFSWIQAQDAGAASNNNLILQRYGNYVGIGDTEPDELLTVKGASPIIHIKNTDETNGGIKFSDADAISTQQFELLYDSDTSSGGNLKFRSDNTDNILVMDPNGSIEIAGNLAVSGQTAGTTHPEFGGVTMALDATDENIGCHAIYWNPDGKLQSNGVDKYGWRAYMGDFSSGTDLDLGFQSSKNGTTSINSRYITHGDSGQAFTGQHPCKPNRPLSIYQSKVGYIVSSTGTISNYPENWTEDTTTVDPLNSVTINESLPIVEMSDQPNDKKVYGVISQVDDPNSTERNNTSQTGGFNNHTSNRIDDRMAINSVGEGAVMVSNINGNLENGDYITTSHIEGLGMRQDDDLLHNYTVAKIIEDCDFASGTTNVTHNGVTYQTKLVGCTYHCG
jgi:hypothetical protein